ncbi:hypothetical protein [Bacillus toyonensis]|uniref:hypothetical protein n=1 Tax=Bacillus toyonensis TaxID=155322 RepID=UPI000BF0D0B3|nr:hypothetical protein [Bacillus toyonensis]PEI49934.1 hypothetical protein CN631_15830 [Bacillus toyonensis]
MNKTHSKDCVCLYCIGVDKGAYEFRELEKRLEKNQENLLINQDKKELKVAVKELHAYMNGNEPMIKLSFDLINKNGEKMSVVREVKTAMLVGNIASHITELAQLIVDSNDLY